MMRLLFASFLLLFAWCAHALDTAPLFAASLIDLDHKPTTLAQWKGKPLIINFWARWCGPCRTEIPELIKLRRQYQARGLEVIGIALEDRGEPVRDFARAYEIDYPILLAKDHGLGLMKDLGNSRMGLPFTIAVSRAGKIAFLKMGAIKGDDPVAAAEAALR